MVPAYEYKVFVIQGLVNTDEVEDKLNELGEDGWRLADMYRGPHRHHYKFLTRFVMYREKA